MTVASTALVLIAICGLVLVSAWALAAATTRRIGASRRQQEVTVIPLYSAAWACPSRLLSAFSKPSAACAITVPGGKIASTPARLSAS